MKLSVIVPAYNEQKTIERTITALSEYLGSAFSDYELIIVSDGSRDDTFRVASDFCSARVKAFEYFPNGGKGHALKYGFGRATGDVVVFFDAGLDFPPTQLKEFYDLLKSSCTDVVIGSKRHPQSKVNYPLKRKLFSLLAQTCTRLLFNLNVTDTQVGLKMFHRRVLDDVFPLMLVKRFAFDIELLALSRHKSYTIIEAPVTLHLNLKTTTAGTFKEVWRTFLDTLGIFYRLKLIKFYDKNDEERLRLLSKQSNSVLDRLISPLYGRDAVVIESERSSITEAKPAENTV